MIKDRIETNIAGGLNFPLPPLARVRQKFDHAKLEDIPGAIRREFARPEVRERVKSGAGDCGRLRQPRHRQHRAIACAVVQELKALGAKPFIFPCDGQPRRRHRRRPAQSAGRLRHHRSVHRCADPRDHGNRHRRQSGRRHAGAHGQATPPRPTHRRHQPHQAAHRRFAARPKAA